MTPQGIGGSFFGSGDGPDEVHKGTPSLAFWHRRERSPGPSAPHSAQSNVTEKEGMVHILLPLVEIIYFSRPVKNFAESTSIFHVIGEGQTDDEKYIFRETV